MGLTRPTHQMRPMRIVPTKMSKTVTIAVNRELNGKTHSSTMSSVQIWWKIETRRQRAISDSEKTARVERSAEHQKVLANRVRWGILNFKIRPVKKRKSTLPLLSDSMMMEVESKDSTRPLIRQESRQVVSRKASLLWTKRIVIRLWKIIQERNTS